jgi:hypothetical protein
MGGLGKINAPRNVRQKAKNELPLSGGAGTLQPLLKT